MVLGRLTALAISLHVGGWASEVTIQSTAHKGYCLDVPGNDGSQGNSVWLWDCNGDASQNWIWDESTSNIKFAGNPSMCIDATGGDIAQGTKLQLWQCNGHENQKFLYDSSDTLALYLNPSQFCIDLPGNDAHKGNLMWIWECSGKHGGTPSQKWTLEGAAPSPATPPCPQSASNNVSNSHGTLETYPAPSSSFPAGPFWVTIESSGKWQDSFVYQTVAQSDAPDAQQGRTASWTTFAFTGTVTVKVWPSKEWAEAIIRPLSLGISTCRSDDKGAVFTLTQPGHLNLEFDGETQNSFMIFAEGPESSADKTADIVYGQGEHNIGTKYVDAGTSIRLEGGAWVRGHFMTDGSKSNIKIVGRGVLSGESIPHDSGGGNADDSKAMLGLCGDDITVKGITIVNPPTYMVNINPYWLGCSGIRTLVEGVKAMGWYFTTDGIMVGRQSTVQDNFVRANDDSLKLYMSDTTWERNTIWQLDNGQSFMLSWNTDTPESNIVVKDCTVVHVEHNHDYGDNARPAVFGSVHGGAGQLSQFSFQNIVVEGAVFRPFGFSQAKNPWGGSGTGSIRGVTLESVSFTDYAQTDSTINGQISNIRFKGLTYAGQLISSASQGNFDVSGGASGIQFSSSEEANSALPPAANSTSLPEADSTFPPEILMM